MEQIGDDHPRIWTTSFQVCAVARCRESGPRPWPCDIGCESLPAAGSAGRRFLLTWGQDLERQAQAAEGTYQETRLTEEGAVGLCAACFSYHA